jgi:hypothetical protein
VTLVPPFIQHVIERRAGDYAYIPTRAPSAYRYRSYTWNPRTKMLTVRLRDKRNASIGVTIEPFRGDCATGNEKSYQVDGNKVFSAGGDLAWRCIRQVKILAAGPKLPASALAITAASVKKL